jgi:threonine dehydrogenase-like Zn-dependent dehydrogenase
LDLASSVTHRLSLIEAPAAMRLLEQRPPGLVRVVIEPSGLDKS